MYPPVRRCIAALQSSDILILVQGSQDSSELASSKVPTTNCKNRSTRSSVQSPPNGCRLKSFWHSSLLITWQEGGLKPDEISIHRFDHSCRCFFKWSHGLPGPYSPACRTCCRCKSVYYFALHRSSRRVCILDPWYVQSWGLWGGNISLLFEAQADSESFPRNQSVVGYQGGQIPVDPRIGSPAYVNSKSGPEESKITERRFHSFSEARAVLTSVEHVGRTQYSIGPKQGSRNSRGKNISQRQNLPFI